MSFKFKVGDKVIVHKPTYEEIEEQDPDCFWRSDMEPMDGLEVVIVKQVTSPYKNVGYYETSFSPDIVVYEEWLEAV